MDLKTLIETKPEEIKNSPEVKAYLEFSSERKAAQSLGMSRSSYASKFFKLIKVCVSCRDVELLEDISRCSSCMKKAAGDPSKKSLYNAEYRQKNLEKLKAYNKEYQRNNLPLFKKAREKYESTAQGKASAQKRRTTRLGLVDRKLSGFDYSLLYKLTNKQCENCGSSINLTLDHHVPLSKGGLTVLENVNLLCVSCNSRKKDKDPKEFFIEEVLEKIEQKQEKLSEYRTANLADLTFHVAKDNLNSYRNFIACYHYSQSCPGIVNAFCVKFQDRVLGVAILSRPSRQNITAGDINNADLLELSRFYTLDACPKNLGSWFLSRCLNWLKEHRKEKAVITFADPTEGHTGGLYKATNFVQIGISPKNYHYETIDGQRVHKRQVWDRAKINGISEKEQAISENLNKIAELPKFKFLYLFNR